MELESPQLSKRKQVRAVETESKDIAIENLSQFDSDFLKTGESVKVSFNYSGLQNFSKIKKMSTSSVDEIFTRQGPA